MDGGGEEGMFHGLVGRGEHFENLVDRLRRFGPSLRTASVLGAAGTGKTAVARAIHRMGPPGAEFASCLARDFFARGSSGPAEAEALGAGTLFVRQMERLDEAGQVAAIHYIERRIHDRSSPPGRLLLGATGIGFPHGAKTLHLRRLHLRMGTLAFSLPPLRERREDIAPLVQHFVDLWSGANRKTLLGLGRDALRPLLAHDWPGNVAELRRVVEQAAGRASTPFIEKGDLPEAFEKLERAEEEAAAAEAEEDAGQEREEQPDLRMATIVRKHAEAVLGLCGGEYTKAALVLGIARGTLYNILRREPKTRGAEGRGSGPDPI